MGMYDYVKCNYPMPKGFEFLQGSNREFQTKDFTNILDEYTITEDGRLIHHEHSWDIVPEEERPYYGKPEWDENPIFKTMGSMKRTHVADKDMDFHGYLNFYTIEYNSRNKPNFYNLTAKFTDGKLVELVVEGED